MTPKQQQFVDEYLIDLNATAAATHAGFRHPNVQGPRLLGNPEVRAAIAAAVALRCEATKIDAEWVLKRLAAEVEADLADIYDKDGRLLPIEAWPPIWRQGLVQAVEVDETTEGGRVTRVRLSDRTKRLEMIGRHVAVGAFKDTVEHKGLDGLADRLQRATQRLRDREGMLDGENVAQATSVPAASSLLTASTGEAASQTASMLNTSNNGKDLDKYRAVAARRLSISP